MRTLADELVIMTDQGDEYLKQLEGLRLMPYPDGNGWSIGRGHFIQPGEEWMMYGITEEEADELYYNDIDLVTEVANEVLTNGIPSSSIFDALIMFGYNIGAYNFGKSQLVALVNDPSASEEEIIDFWLKTWVGVPAKEILLNRRKAEVEYAFGEVEVKSKSSLWWLAAIAAGTYIYSKS